MRSQQRADTSPGQSGEHPTVVVGGRKSCVARPEAVARKRVCHVNAADETRRRLCWPLSSATARTSTRLPPHSRPPHTAMSLASRTSALRHASSLFKQRTPTLAAHSRRLHPLAADWSGLVGHAPPVTANLVPIVIEQTVSDGISTLLASNVCRPVGPRRKEL